MAAEADAVRARGGVPYVIAGGGSVPLGALGYVACAQEILAQCYADGVAFDRIVVASGSAGTHSGLLVGLHAASWDGLVTGINVRRAQAEQEGNVHTLAVQTAALLRTSPPERADVVCLDRWVGPGYSLPTPEMAAAVRTAARTEGVLLDPVYTGKAFAGLLGLIESGEIGSGERVLFIHTGGSPALHAYADQLR
jgi:D-cysteine desulfhydrase